MSTELRQHQQAELRQRESTRAGLLFRPDVDIVETNDEIIVYADVPGASADGISLNYEQGELRLHAAVQPRQQEGSTRYLLREYGVADYHREFVVNEPIDAERISAELHDGVLRIRLPKADAAKPRQITVQAS